MKFHSNHSYEKYANFVYIYFPEGMEHFAGLDVWQMRIYNPYHFEWVTNYSFPLNK